MMKLRLLTHKKCAKCGKLKPYSDFHKDSSKSNGVRCYCKACAHINNTLESVKKIRHTSNNKNKFSRRASNTFLNHKRLGYTMTITQSEIETLFRESEVCPICGIKYITEYGVGHSNSSQSLDRIDNDKELRSDNVWVICQKCNTLKGDSTMKEFVKRSKMVVEKFEGRV